MTDENGTEGGGTRLVLKLEYFSDPRLESLDQDPSVQSLLRGAGGNHRRGTWPATRQHGITHSWERLRDTRWAHPIPFECHLPS